ncbi:MAG TPA: ADP-ribosylation factor-like protein, partial [Planctomycetota bacterium]|nr:ADP-ribosylation factor-like protein [Planctomycetota bacterium]
MVQFNFFRREVNCKIVYYGPGLSGKTTNLEMVHKKTPSSHRGELTSIATEQDRTLFFDFMPIDLGTVAGMKTKLRLFTVPGQVFYNSTRKLVLQGADGIIFVADSQRSKLQENLESLKNLEENLRLHKMDIREMPLVIQWNKRDMPDIFTVEELEEKINYLKVPTFEGVAMT